MSTLPKVAIVTGAGSGIGRQTALALLAAGFRVVLAGRREDALQQSLSAADHPEHGIVQATDVSEVEAVRQLFQTTVDQFGRLDLLFNNAGANIPGVPIEDISIDQWRRVVDVNLTGAFLCAQAAVRQMKLQEPQGGRIINNGSISAHAPRPNSVAYTATKHAITGLTKSIALDGRAFNIACGQIDIGNAETPMTARMKEGVPQADGSLAAEPTIDANHIANTVVFMANLPLDVNVPFTTVMANTMPFIGRG